VTATLKTVTLGCKVNQYETQFVREGLLGAGFIDADENHAADLCIVNTCTVTSEGDAKSRQIIRRMHRENPAARIVVMGCYATRAPAEVANLPGVSEVVTDKRELPDLLGRFGVVDLPSGISGLRGRHRAYVKVQDGCLLNCSYCIIPKVRPHMYSRPATGIIAEVKQLVARGFHEIVLTGIHLGHYGVDFNAGKPRRDWVRLATLVRDLCESGDGFRIRLSSIEATEVTRDLIALMNKYSNRVCPHLHVCLQSGSDRILRKMQRRWNAKRIVDRCRLVSDNLDNPAFTTDVIVGFPGESDADFQQTIDVCRQIGFSKMHIFPFSPRRGTAAAEMPEQVHGAIKSQRIAQLTMVETELREHYVDSLIGRPLHMLVERFDPITGYAGTSCRYVWCEAPPTASPLLAAAESQFIVVTPTSKKGSGLFSAK
jgi:threonylcarbamoyladenosine tRNA methylthiotransferase MtaB